MHSSRRIFFFLDFDSERKRAPSASGYYVHDGVQGAMGTATFVEVLLAILLPPVGVFLRYGCGVSDDMTPLCDRNTF